MRELHAVAHLVRLSSRLIAVCDAPAAAAAADADDDVPHFHTLLPLSLSRRFPLSPAYSF